MHSVAYFVGVMLSDEALKIREFEWGKDKPAGDNWILYVAAQEAAQYCRLQQSRNLQDRYLDSNKAAKMSEVAAQGLACSAIIEAELGNRDRAQNVIAKSEALALTRANGGCLRVAAGLAGDKVHLQRLLDHFTQKYPADTLMQSAYLPIGRALLDSSSNATKSLDELRPAAKFDLAPALSFWPIYVRGLVYSRAGRPRRLRRNSKGFLIIVV